MTQNPDPAQDRASIKISKRLHTALKIESARTSVDLGMLLERAWEAWIHREDGIDAEVEARILNRYSLDEWGHLDTVVRALRTAEGEGRRWLMEALETLERLYPR